MNRKHKRLEKWVKRTARSYSAGLIDGADLCHTGCPRPEDPDDGYDAPFDLNFYFWPTDQLSQYARNCELARQRGAVDGFDQAEEMRKIADDEDWVEEQAERGFEEMCNWLGRQAA